MSDQGTTAVKICGLTSVQQALSIALLGVDAIGVIGVAGSPRFIKEEKRRKIFDSLIKNAPTVERVWVVANIDSKSILEGVRGIGTPSIVQLHGKESKQRCEEWRELYPHIKWWKSFQIRQADDLVLAQTYQESVDALLLDAWSNKSLGGTGKRVPIELLSKVNFNIPWWLAGGISPEWTKEILPIIKPFGIDASSKLEVKPGVKDLRKVEALLKEVKAHK